MVRTYGRMTPRHALQLAAPHTWAASVCPALFGILYSILRGWQMPPLGFAALFVTCVLMQSAVNTLNDYMDFVKGTDSKSDNVEAGDAAILYGNLDPKQVLILGLGYSVAAAVLGLLACIGRGPIPVIVGVLGGLIVVVYSAGPLPISYLPVGEAVSGFVMGGLIPLGIVSAASGAWHPEVILYSLPFILGIALIMMSNNGCDIDKDIRAGRMTMAVRLKRERTAKLYHALVIFWFVLILGMSALFLPAGITGILLLVLLARRPFAELIRSGLFPEERIRQMRTILAANITGNGAYLAAVAAALVWGRIHG